MTSKAKKNIHRRGNKHIRKEWRDWCYDLINSKEEEIDFIIERNLQYSNPYQIVI